MSLSATIFGRDSFIFKATNTLGLGIPGYLDKKFGPPETEGPRLSDLSVQTSTYGAQIARFYGTIPAHGNVFWLENGKYKETAHKKKQGGKGGGSSSGPDKTYTYSATFAIALGEGQLAGIKRIWCRDKLLYNSASDDLETIIASNQNASGWRFYPGSDDQLPDPRIEAEKGVGNTPAYRGTAYIVFDDFQLEDYGNTLEGAQFKFEVVQNLEVNGAQVSADLYSIPFPYSSSSNGSAGAGYDKNGFASFQFLDVGLNRVVQFKKREGATFIYPMMSLAFSPAAIGCILESDDFAFTNGGINPTNIYIGFEGAIKYTSPLRLNVRQVAQGSEGVLILSSGLGDLQVDIVQDYSNSLITSFGISTSDLAAPNIAWYGEKILAVSKQFSSSPFLVKIYDKEGVVESDISVARAGSNIVTGTNAGIYVDGGYLYAFNITNTEVLAAKIDIDLGVTVYTTVIPHTLGTITVPQFPSITKISSDAFSIALRVQDSGDGNRYKRVIVRLTSETIINPSLASIIESEVSQSNLIEASDLDVTLLTDYVRGYQVSGGSIRSALEPLQGVWPFDVIQSGYKLKCVPRGQASVATIPWEHLGANDGDESGYLLKQSREMDTQLPASTHIKYWDVNREYAQGEQYADRPGTSAVNRVDLEVALVMNAQEAARAVDVLQALRWLERIDFEASLPPIYLALEPADVITILYKNATYQLRIKEKNDTPSGIGQCKLVPNAPSIYTSTAKGAEGVSPPETIPLPGNSLAVLLDIPLVDEVSQNAVGFVTAMTGYTDGWPGGVLVRSSDGGQTWDDLQGYTGKGGIGFATGELAVSEGYLIDQSSLIVSFLSGEPYAITAEQLLTGYNYAAYGVNGRWEIVRFQNATQNTDGSYTLSGFVRGDKGTEWATGLHQVGDYFVMLDDPDNAFIGAAVQTIGLARDYRAVTSGASIDDADNINFTYNGVNLECLSPVNAMATRDGSGNLSATFTRRSRLSSTWWANGVEAPVGETSQAYEIDVMSGSTVKRTITASTPAFSYSAADQTTDFGSVQASITFRIYQLSETVGRGFVREVTL